MAYGTGSVVTSSIDGMQMRLCMSKAVGKDQDLMREIISQTKVQAMADYAPIA